MWPLYISKIKLIFEYWFFYQRIYVSTINPLLKIVTCGLHMCFNGPIFSFALSYFRERRNVATSTGKSVTQQSESPILKSVN